MGYDKVPSAEQTSVHLAERVGGPLEREAVTHALTQELMFAEDSFLVLAHAHGALDAGPLERHVFGPLGIGQSRVGIRRVQDTARSLRERR